MLRTLKLWRRVTKMMQCKFVMILYEMGESINMMNMIEEMSEVAR